MIIGGGIGGLTTALALHRRGIRADVYEQAGTLSEVGAGLVLAPNALAILDRLGLGPVLEKQSWPLDMALISRADGQPLQAVDVLALKQRYGYGMRVIQRGKLQKLLMDALPSDQLHPNHSIAELHDDGLRVAVAFSNGRSRSADFLVGADGIRSWVRRTVLSEKPLRYAGQTCWRTLLDVPLAAPHTSTEYWGRRAGVRFGLVPCGAGQLYLYVTAAAPAGERDDPAQLADRLRTLSRGFASEVSQVLDRLDVSRVHRADLYDLPTLTAWSKGRVALLGDAAHATTPNLGQGACLAIEGSFVLAGCLDGATSVAQAFGHYQRLHKPKTDRVVQLSRQIGQAVGVPAWLKPLMFAGMQRIPPSLTTRQFATVYDLRHLNDFL